MSFWLFVVAWIGCGVLGYGVAFAYFQRQYPLSAKDSYSIDRVFCVLYLITGPAGLLVAFVCSRWAKHGVLYR